MHFEYMELYIKKRVSAADFLGIFRIVWEDVVLMDEVLPEAALSDLSAEVDPHLCCVVLFFVIMCRTIYDY
jgi:translation initiation factor 6 (eIF-6)